MAQLLLFATPFRHQLLSLASWAWRPGNEATITGSLGMRLECRCVAHYYCQLVQLARLLWICHNGIQWEEKLLITLTQ